LLSTTAGRVGGVAAVTLPEPSNATSVKPVCSSSQSRATSPSGCANCPKCVSGGVDAFQAQLDAAVAFGHAEAIGARELAQRVWRIGNEAHRVSAGAFADHGQPTMQSHQNRGSHQASYQPKTMSTILSARHPPGEKSCRMRLARSPARPQSHAR
jgi:hypothetical protein